MGYLTGTSGFGRVIPPNNAFPRYQITPPLPVWRILQPYGVSDREGCVYAAAPPCKAHAVDVHGVSYREGRVNAALTSAHFTVGGGTHEFSPAALVSPPPFLPVRQIGARV